MASDTVITGYVPPMQRIHRVPGTPVGPAFEDTDMWAGNAYRPGGSGRYDVSVGTRPSGESFRLSAASLYKDTTPVSAVLFANELASTASFYEDLMLAEPLRARSIVAALQSRGEDPASIVKYIHDSAGLTITEIAKVLDVSRRSIYHWLGGEAVSSENHQRLLDLLQAIQPMADIWGPRRTNLWVRSTADQRIAKGDAIDSLGRAVEEALSADEIPVLAARRLEAQSDAPDIAPVSQSELSSALAAFTRPRAVEDRHEWTPREMAWSPPETDDD